MDDNLLPPVIVWGYQSRNYPQRVSTNKLYGIYLFYFFLIDTNAFEKYLSIIFIYGYYFHYSMEL